MTVFQAYLLQQFPCSPAGQCTNTIPLAVTAWMQSLRDGTVANVVNWQKGSALSRRSPRWFRSPPTERVTSMRALFLLLALASLCGCASQSENDNAFWGQASPTIGKLIK